MISSLRERKATRPALIIAAASLVGTAGALLFPLSVAAHALHGRVESPLPFTAYILGAAVAVALSFAFVAISDEGSSEDGSEATVGPARTFPRWARLTLRTIGLVGWLWVVAQTLVGGFSDAEVASLVLWVFGWVGLALVSGLVGPVWSWLDPFTTLYDGGRALAERMGIEPGEEREWPAGLGAWLAVGFMLFFVWLELAARVNGGRNLGFVLIGYTVVTLAGMAWFGPDRWRTRAEVFSVWLGLLGRLASWGLDGPADEGQVRRRGFGATLVTAPWTMALLTVAAVATGSVIYDGLSQTEPFFDLFGVPALPAETVILFGFLAIIAGLILAVGRHVGPTAMGAGLIPVALGYIVAHYITFLLVEGQRVVVAISDPLQQGWDLFGTAFWGQREDILPTTLAWTIQVGAVVIGHIVGAWLGHRAIRRSQAAGHTVSQWPLAVLMIGLTVLTLWSLGQNLAFEALPVEPERVASIAAIVEAFGRR